MKEKSPQSEPDVYAFILEDMDTVPHLEALMLLWNSRPVGWTCEELASRLYVPREKVSELLADLVRKQLVIEAPSTAAAPAKFSYYVRSEEQNLLMRLVDAAYRHDLVRISTMIHSKASSAVRAFARAFRFRKDEAR